MSETVDVLLPTCDRVDSLILTLSGLAAQNFSRFHLVVAEQSTEPARNLAVVAAALRILSARGASVTWHRRAQIHGIAEQRDFLLRQAASDFVLYLDDDVYMEPWVLGRLFDVIRSEQCAFVGAFPAGLSYADDIRPHQQHIEYWTGPVRPESIDPASPEWERAQLHRAANLWHVSREMPAGLHRLYKVAWIASCILYDRKKLLEIGGFSFWNRLPRFHAGEEVLAQNLLMRRWGGCAIIPSGAYHAEVRSTVLNPAGTVDGHALDLLPEMITKYSL